jgi:hypothetical protein
MSSMEDRRSAIIDKVRAMDDTKQHTKPETGGFSPVEVIEHFALMESFNADFLDRTPPETLSSEKTAIRVMGKMVLKGLKDPSKYMGNTLPAAVPRSNVGIETAAVHWGAVRSRLRNHFQGVTDPDAAFIKMMWFFGTLSANQYLELLESHLDYHEKRMPK